MVQDMVGKRLQKSISCYRKDILFFRKRVEATRQLCLLGKKHKLRKANDCNRQMLAKFKVHFWFSPDGSLAPTAPSQPTEAGYVRPSPESSGPQDGECSCWGCPGIWGHLQVPLSFHSSWASTLTARAPHLSFC